MTIKSITYTLSSTTATYIVSDIELKSLRLHDFPHYVQVVVITVVEWCDVQWSQAILQWWSENNKGDVNDNVDINDDNDDNYEHNMYTSCLT